MRIFRHYESLPQGLRGGAIAVGNFDGVHLGHEEVIGQAGRIAQTAGIPWAVMTLEPHPRSVFAPDAPPFRLAPFSAKARLIERLGPQVLIVIHFDLPFSRISAPEFVERIIVSGAGAKHVVCGHDFAFGRGRQGDAELLLRLGEEFGFGFTCVPEMRDCDGKPYSSTRVREYLRAGQPADAARLLGRTFEIEGRVVEGDRRGRTIGFPTANIRLGEYIQPAMGVYAVRAGIQKGARTEWRDGVANLGVRPTFGGKDVVLEVHLLDYDGDLYGEHLRVALIDYLRKERKFEGVKDLKTQIAEDTVHARNVLASAANPTEINQTKTEQTAI
jgi:riboflavin kinase/FMN adenylyltransferase